MGVRLMKLGDGVKPVPWIEQTAVRFLRFVPELIANPRHALRMVGIEHVPGGVEALYDHFRPQWRAGLAQHLENRIDHHGLFGRRF